MVEFLNSKHQKTLLEIARASLIHRLAQGSPPQRPGDKKLLARAAAFVTLTMSEKLRGCIGNLEPVGPLWEGVRDNAASAALHDHRFSPLTRRELEDVCLEISVLSPAKTLQYRDSHEIVSSLTPGVDGVILRDGARAATFLPQVWQQLPEPEQFLTQLCCKASLPGALWREKKLDIETYRVQSFKEDKQ